jgi:ATP-dependent DNA ligase
MDLTKPPSVHEQLQMPRKIPKFRCCIAPIKRRDGKYLLEVKFDGYRMRINRERGKSRFFTRSGLNWLSKFAFIREGLERLPTRHHH